MNEPNVAIAPPPAWRFSPSVAIGTLCLITYIAVFYGIAQASGIDYGEWFANANNAIHSALIPLVAGSLLLITFLVLSRWNVVWRDPVRLPTNRLHATLMYLFVGTILLRLVFIKWGEVPADLLLVVIAVGIGVGFAEEMALRGVFLRGVRTNGRSEGRAVLWTTIAFGLLHIPNIFLGTGLIGIAQLLLAALTGFVLYLFRRRFAWIVPAMIAHGIWDISVFLSKDYLSPAINTLTIALTAVIQLLALIALVQFVRSEREPAFSMIQ
ncbi:lysostaphin resistance A-like protein [Propionivibrio sp.]|uniref:CPBP family intramembrane glutamic endopeptidase n=1 Tax=Propionivibrio sp. TaxID=2212460 RepID=UPI003BF199FB